MIDPTKAAASLRRQELAYFSELIEARAGIHLKPVKSDLIRSRLQPRLAAHGLRGFAEYRDLLASLSDRDPEWEIFTNLLTTNKTDFFREPKHFDHLIRKILPAWLKTGERTFNVWSAACSTGEEPFTLAMVLARHLPGDRDFRILATDIDTHVLARAANAVYPISKKTEIPREYHRIGLDCGRGPVRDWFRIKEGLKSRVCFERHNLIDRESPPAETFDLVLCRNVLIYFAPPTVDFVQAKLYPTVKTGGHLFIGHSDSIQGTDHRWQLVGQSVFRKDSVAGRRFR